MTHSTKPAPRRGAVSLAPAMTALLLAGCSTGHIGESWQCPLAEGGSCDSVAAADPAVPEAGASGSTVLAGPLWRMRGDGRPESPPASCAAECDGDFDPFAWLVRLFGAQASEGEAGSPGGSARPPSATPAQPPDAGPNEDAAARAAARTVEPATAALPGEPGPAQDDSREGDLRGDELRTGEVVARIWIAPFVDADGVYREASHVRVVLEPAGWRLK